MDPPARASAHARPQAQRRADLVNARPATGRGYQPLGLSTGVADVGLLDPQKILSLQETAGNTAVASLLARRPSLQRQPAPALLLGGREAAGPFHLQREIGWKSDASNEGKRWNVGQQDVGQIHRIPLEGLKEGLQQESAKRWVKATDKVKGQYVDESTMIPGLSPESAKGKAIVLVPAGLDPTQPVEVLIHLHGYTEKTGRPFAGWRALNTKADKTALRKGIDKDDVAPVRDVALDQAEQQLEESGYKQTVIVLPQGGLRSQFGKMGDTNFDSGAYSKEIVKRLFDEKVWKHAKKEPEIGRVSMAGHSGAGATLANMARESVRHAAKPGTAQGASSALTGDLVLFDAINPGELGAFKDWALMRLNQDLAALKARPAEADRLTYLKTAPKLRGYYSTKPDVGYVDPYTKLDGAISTWFGKHKAKLGSLAAPLRANFTVVPVAVAHEELMRGVAAGKDRKGSGDILDALRALHGDLKPAAPKPTGAAKPADTPTPASSTTPASKAKPARTRKATAPASAAESRAEYIATAILLAKTGGEGEGKTEEERKAAKEAAEASVKRDIEKGTKKDIDAWFQGLEPDATFLGLRIHRSSPDEPPGVHHELAVKLAAAEASLVNAKAGEKPIEAAARLGVKYISGMRVPKTPTGKTSGASMHCFGLAVDIDHDNNPFVGNKDKPEKAGPGGGPSLQIIQHATLLLAGFPDDVRREPPELKGKPKTDSEADRAARAARAVEQWKLVHADSELVRQYLSMSTEELDAALTERLPALKAWKEAQTAEPPASTGSKKKKKKRAGPPAWVEHVTEADWWHGTQKRDRKQSMKGDFGRGETSDPTKFGFMTLHEEVVKALVGAGLSWGGTYNGDKDVMHFDLRTGSIGGRPVV